MQEKSSRRTWSYWIRAEAKKKHKFTLKLSSVGYREGKSCHCLPEIGSQGPGGICETVHMMLLIYPKHLIPESCTGVGLPAPAGKINVLIEQRERRSRTNTSKAVLQSLSLSCLSTSTRAGSEWIPNVKYQRPNPRPSGLHKALYPTLQKLQ